jgi:hypothetical protein
MRFEDHDHIAIHRFLLLRRNGPGRTYRVRSICVNKRAIKIDSCQDYWLYS